MPAKVTSCALIGLDGASVEVEVDISRGPGTFTNEGFDGCRDIRTVYLCGWLSEGIQAQPVLPIPTEVFGRGAARLVWTGG